MNVVILIIRVLKSVTDGRTHRVETRVAVVSDSRPVRKRDASPLLQTHYPAICIERNQPSFATEIDYTEQKYAIDQSAMK